jgi:hypothetical protein
MDNYVYAPPASSRYTNSCMIMSKTVIGYWQAIIHDCYDIHVWVLHYNK